LSQRAAFVPKPDAELGADDGGVYEACATARYTRAVRDTTADAAERQLAIYRAMTPAQRGAYPQRRCSRHELAARAVDEHRDRSAASGIAHMVVGSFASSVHGVPRTTSTS